MNKKNTFDDFVNAEVAKTKKPEHIKEDWEKRKKDWVKQTQDFFQKIRLWLKEYTDSGNIKLESSEITINEEELGSYKVDELNIVIGSKVAKLTPYGTILIGASGRIDLTYGTNKIKFILTNKDLKGIGFTTKIYSNQAKEKIEKENKEEVKKMQKTTNLEWKIATEPPIITFKSLDKESFLNVLMAAMVEK